jgi:putative acetyltransferase
MDSMRVEIRREVLGEALLVHQVNELAFGGSAEADIIDRLRQTCPDFISSVAVVDGRIVGHILFTPAWLESPHGQVNGMGLAPLAVLPEYQNQGVGGKLTQAGLLEMQEAGWPFVIVLGHPGYYPRFGFELAAKYSIRCEYNDVPEEAFMITVFDQNVLHPEGAVAHYRPEWAEAT